MNWHVILLFSLTSTIVFCQESDDTLGNKELTPIIIEGLKIPQDIQRLEAIKGTFIYSGKKTEVVELSQKNASLTEKYGRQIFAKIPGIFVYDMDGTGNQMNISTRGLDPHRSWEFNNRKDGIITNSDMYGYPASHYNIPMEAVERIEVVRGTGSLQYGAQFGGMLNYISKKPETNKISFENISTMGSYGLVSTFHRASGTLNKFRYCAWVNKKWITGYRKNSDSQYNAEGLTLYYDVTNNFHVKLEWTHSNYISHLPGPLTDNMFKTDPSMSTRSRNYYNPNIHIPSISMNWNLRAQTKLQFTTSAILGARNSVLFDKPATVADTVVAVTLKYNNRQVDIDHFNSYTSELRLLHSYSLMKQTSSISTGVQYMNNNLHRQQQGKGTTGTDFDLTLVTPGWGRDLNYKTHNLAFFAENLWKISKRLSINTGARLEVGETNLSGVISYYADTAIPNKIKHNFPLFGISTQYDLSKKINIYAGCSQAYRPVIFKDIIPASIYEKSDKNLKDAYGYNVEAGFRGKWNNWKWDFTGFYLKYNNRLGTLAQSDSSNNLIIFRTNIGDSRTVGIEFFLQKDYSLSKKMNLSLFTSTSFMDARYQNASIKSGSENISIDNKKVESVPTWISRNGITLKYSIFSFSTLYSYTAESFADPLNTIIANVSGTIGLVPSYSIFDFNLASNITEKVKIQINVNNAFDEHYFTKRPQFYPGPGIWSSDGRTFSATVSIKI